MKICTKCNHVLREEETACPYCGAPVTGAAAEADPADGALEQADTIDIVDEVDYATATLELPMGYVEDGAMIVSDTIDTASHEQYDFPPEEGEPEFDYVPDEPDDPEGDLELEAMEGELDEPDGGGILGKLGVTLLAILAAAVFVFGVSCLVRYMKEPPASDSALMLQYISGTWLSEPFVFAEDTSHSYVEEFTVYQDGSFTLRHLVPDARFENGYEEGLWEVDYRISGTVELLPENRCLLLEYAEFGQEYYFDRYLIETGDDRLVLREFYDDAATESYDIIYKRVAAGRASPGEAA